MADFRSETSIGARIRLARRERGFRTTSDLAEAILSGQDIGADPVLSKHLPWVEELKERHSFTEENTMELLLMETGKVFAGVLEDAGVYKPTEEGREAFLRFIDTVNS